MQKYLLVLIVLLLSLGFYGCAGEPAVAPTEVPVESTATLPPTEEPVPTATEESAPATSTATVESQAPTEDPTSPPEPTATPTLEPTPEPTEEAAAVEATPTEEPGQSSSGQTDPGPKPDCEEKAAFYGDVTIPDDTTIRQGEVFVKTWRVRNEGTCTWNADYNLVFAGGSQMSGLSESPLPDAAPGDIIEIPIELTAPFRGGTYVGNWMFSDPYGNWFGVGATRKGELWLRINVNYISDEGSDAGSTGTSGTSTGGTATGGTEPAACGSERNTAYENEVLTLLNNARSSNGLSPLTMNDQLTAAALSHSSDMACNDFVDHAGSDGTLWFDRISTEGYVYTTAKENIYVGNPAFGGTPAGAFDWWMNSQIHRENILSEDISEIGIAYVFNANSSYGGYYTTVFARP